MRLRFQIESNNNIGTIYVERVDAGNSAGTLNYTTGISGTQGIPNVDGSINDTQSIVVNTNSATLNINGAGGVDKFNIEASSFTKTLTIAGNLGTVPNYEEANNNYDTVRIDLSKTSGVNLDISKLLVSNPNNEGIVITASKGADNITLTTGANHDVVEFSAGGEGTSANAEQYQVDLANLRLGTNQSFTIDGLTITNIGNSFVPASQIADAIAIWVNNGNSFTDAQGKSLQINVDGTLTDVSEIFGVSGKMNSLAGDWAVSKANAVVANNGKLTFTSNEYRNVDDLKLTWSANSTTKAPQDIKATLTKSHDETTAEFTALNATTIPAVPSAAAEITATTQFKFGANLDVTSGSSSSLELKIGSETYTITATNENATADKAASLKGVIDAINATTGKATDTTNNDIKYAIKDSSGNAANLTTLITASSASGELVLAPVTQSSANGTITLTSPTTGGFANTTGGNYTAKAYQPATPAGRDTSFTFAGIGTAAQAYQPAASAKPESAAEITATTQFKFGTGGTDLDVTANNGTKALELTINGETYTITATNANAADKAASLKGVIDAINATTGTATDTTNTDITYAIKDSSGNAANLTTLITASSASGELVLAPATQSSANGTITLTSPTTGGFANTTGGAYTAKAYQPATEAQDQIGTKAEVTGGELKWLPTDIRAGSTTEILKVVIGGDTYTIEGTAKVDNAGGVGLSTTNLKTILENTVSSGSVTDVSGDVLDYVVKFNGVQTANGIGTLLSAAKVKVDDSVPNKIKIVEDTNYSGDGSTISITTGRGAAQSQSATWTLVAEAGVPAQNATSVFTIAKSTGDDIKIGITGAGLTDVAVADAVYELLTTGKLPSAFAGEVTINGAAYTPGNASGLKTLFALPAGLAYSHTNGTNKIDIDSSGLDSAYAENLNITFSQDGAADVQQYQITGASGQDFGQIVVDFGSGLLAGQSYTFNGKTIIATKNLSGEDVANAFTYDAGDGFDGAVIVSDFDNTQINNDVGWSIEGSRLTIIGTSTSSIGEAASDTVTGTGALATNTNRVSGTTIVQGSDGRGQHADSYVEFSSANLGGSGAAANIVANTSALDTISNFDTSNDALRLKDSVGNVLTETNVQRGDLYAGAIYLDTAGSVIDVAHVNNGIISFSVDSASGATAASITLDQKLYVATHAMANNRIAGFEHGGDFYVVATGSNANSTADDLVIKLAGVGEGSIGNIANILA